MQQVFYRISFELFDLVLFLRANGWEMELIFIKILWRWNKFMNEKFAEISLYSVQTADRVVWFEKNEFNTLHINMILWFYDYDVIIMIMILW